MDSNIAPENNGASLKVIILSTILLVLGLTVMAAFFSAINLSNDQIRVKDVALIQKFLAAYKINNGMYPASSLGQPQGYEKYLESYPKSPAKAGSCTDSANAYQYEVLNQGQSYRLSFCLGRSTGKFISGINIVGPDDYNQE